MNTNRKSDHTSDILAADTLREMANHFGFIIDSAFKPADKTVYLSIADSFDIISCIGAFVPGHLKSNSLKEMMKIVRPGKSSPTALSLSGTPYFNCITGMQVL